MLPEQFSISGETRENSRAILYINVAGFGIDGRARVSVTQIDDVAEEVVEEMPPERFSSLGIEARDAFLKLGTLSLKTHHVKAPVRNHRGGLPWKVRAPESILGVNLLR